MGSIREVHEGGIGMSRSTVTMGTAAVFVMALGMVLSACGGGTSSTSTTQPEGTTSSVELPTIAPTTTSTSASQGSATTTQPVTSTTQASTSTTTQTTTGPAGLTIGVTEGPYYVSNTAELTDGNLNYTDLPGDPIKLSGFVYGGVGDSTPLVAAKIEIWQADSSGTYHPNGNGDANNFGVDQLALRGYVLTDSSGHYEFTSIYPGIYPGRCRHIHVRASAASYGAVVSQLIVPALPGDSQTPETDQIAQALPDVNDLKFTTNNGVQEATFDFHLAGD